MGAPADPLKSAGPEQELHTLKPGNAAASFQMVHADPMRLARRQLSRESPITDLPVVAFVHETHARVAKLAIPNEHTAFFSHAALAMRSVILDYVRNRETGARDGIEVALTVADDVALTTPDHVQILPVCPVPRLSATPAAIVD